MRAVVGGSAGLALAGGAAAEAVGSGVSDDGAGGARATAATLAVGVAAGATDAGSPRGMAHSAVPSPTASTTPAPNQTAKLERGRFASSEKSLVRVTTRSRGTGAAGGMGWGAEARSEAPGATEAR